MTRSTRITQQELDASQYQTESILHYEAIYGAGFVSPGGAETARELIARLGLEPGARVLDAGCGLGGSAFLMAREFGFQVDGIDLSRNMLALAERRRTRHGLGDRVRLRHGDCLELDARETYHAVYSRDVFLHVADKRRLFTRLHAALRAGGRLLFTDYCCGPRPWSDDFSTYVDARGYDLQLVDDYAGLIAAAGFERVRAEDISARFVEILRREIERIERLELEPATRARLEASWQQKLARALDGDHRWGLFSAVKP